jgi:hypothetical protein
MNDGYFGRAFGYVVSLVCTFATNVVFLIVALGVAAVFLGVSFIVSVFLGPLWTDYR